jgi:MFS family permease
VFALSGVGQTVGTIAVTTVVYESTGSASWAAAAAAARLLPYLACSGLAGVLADRRDRRSVLGASLAVRAALATVLAAVTATGGPAWVLIAVTLALTAAGTPCYPAVGAVTPTLVRECDLAAANGLVTTIDAVAFLVGPALGGCLLVAGPVTVLVVDVAVLLAGLALLTRIEPLPSPSGVRRERLRRAIAAGVQAVATRRAAWPFALLAATNFVYGAAIVILLPLATERLGSGDAGYGILNTAFGVGVFAGIALVNRVARIRRGRVALAVAVLVSGLPFAVLGVVAQPAVVTGLLVLAGVANIVTEVGAVTMLQRAVPAAVLARVFGLYDAVAVASVLAGSAVAPAVLRAFGLDAGLLVLGLAAPAAALALYPLRTRGQTADSAVDASSAATAEVRITVGVTTQRTPSASTAVAKAASATSITSAPTTSR